MIGDHVPGDFARASAHCVERRETTMGQPDENGIREIMVAMIAISRRTLRFGTSLHHANLLKEQVERFSADRTVNDIVVTTHTAPGRFLLRENGARFGMAAVAAATQQQDGRRACRTIRIKV